LIKRLLQSYDTISSSFHLPSDIILSKAGDVLGRKRVFLFALVSFLIGSALCGASVTLAMLATSRAIQGIGAGGLMSLVMILLADLTPMRDRGKYQGMLGGVLALSNVSGPLLGGVFSDSASWRWLLYVSLNCYTYSSLVTSIFLLECSLSQW
jgi:MFS family permease